MVCIIRSKWSYTLSSRQHEKQNFKNQRELSFIQRKFAAKHGTATVVEIECLVILFETTSLCHSVGNLVDGIGRYTNLFVCIPYDRLFHCTSFAVRLLDCIDCSRARCMCLQIAYEYRLNSESNIRQAIGASVTKYAMEKCYHSRCAFRGEYRLVQMNGEFPACISPETS